MNVAKLKPMNGRQLAKLLCNEFGFSMVRIHGSHATLSKGNTYVTVPLKDIGLGLLVRILRDAGIGREDFLSVL